MFLHENPVSFTKAMLSYIFVLTFLSLSVNSADVPIFHKCCPEDQNLIKVTVDLNITLDVRYVCLNAEVRENYNVSSDVIPLLVVRSENVQFYMPEECQLELIHTIGPNFEITTDDDVCYDRLVLEIVNDLSRQIVPKTVALACVKNETRDTLRSTLTIDHVRKCCPGRQRYDTVYHVCRNSVEYSKDDWLMKQLTNYNTDSKIYEIDFGLHCKSNEYAVELSEYKYTIDIEGRMLKVGSRTGTNKDIIPSGEWCIDREHVRGDVVARVCTNDCSKFDAYCLRKCCPVGHHFKPRHCGKFASTCVPNADDDEAVYFNISSYLDPLKEHYKDIKDTLGIRTGLACPHGRTALNRSSLKDYQYLTPSGTLDSAISVGNDYCIETFDTRDCQDDVTVTAVVCFIAPPSQFKDFRISFVLISISSVCLALTLLVYCTLPELRNQHGRTLTCHLSMMLLAYSCLARVQYDVVENTLICTLLGYGIYFGFVAAFAWLNVMCVDIWWTFGRTRSLQKGKSQRNRFIWYSVYAWSSSILLTLTTFLFDTYPVSPFLDSNIGNGMCWFGAVQNDKSDWPHYIFFVAPMGIVTCMNFVLWVLTARHCARVKSEMHRLQAGSAGDRAKRRFRIDQAKYILTGKLWVVMGAGWVSELLSTLTHEPRWLWFVVDLLNELQGVFIFIILIFKPKLYYLIRKRLGLEKPDMRKSGPSSSARTSSTYLSRTISHEPMRISLANNEKEK
ncbi:G-protein coupled receptor Mth2-like isoform X2 [Achroia grisella]|uniref:G-protein coupled receptor Mth2-like isoform X2 n=1 Tax=Achroia grisella TaxID=688607 RepID=UPI0027D29957|nr:G-protein coupled receptor Mth2-like isoform X2 [Achroia grisella]